MVLRGGIAKDRESAYWLSLQEIPPKAGSANKLVIAVRSRLKVLSVLTDLTLPVPAMR
ncbi:hypothetical protein DMB90_13130 [Raoultella planticola]|uniref:Pili assembly chaperone N-terminal domain-containing protein n=1 Tax=Raoultella planticola TaxID=575 RepID=A0A5P6A9Y5_RAOPL|nr:hypothetical protein DMB90_13130 [Raoultella planticola]